MTDDERDDFLDQADESRFADVEDPLIRKIAEAVDDLDEDKVAELTQQAIDEEKPPLDILQRGLTNGVKTVGDKFGRGEVFLPELAMAADAMKAGVELVDPLLAEMEIAEEDEAGLFVIGTVDEDIHNIGKNIVVTMLKANGFDVIDLGVEVPNEKFVEAVDEHDPDILGMSALMTMTMDHQAEVVDLLEEKGLRVNVKVMVGGAPTSPEWRDEIGADGYGDNADAAVKRAKNLLEEARAEGAEPAESAQ
ncbi:corrinoid protein [Haloarculaceae archaeon H-GB2-1]|nr:corrinoid protein [Haloarculaceae archaeon H-GB1-1]MEA5387961.1 corrinoid protein [Haloarculaceae archaeon H-GB11]MEA5409452.1 corrinoid protein [Haloarculaceae archaeon H-GB2-1]